MKISIAVPSYNYARFLVPCLESIKQQNYIDYEVLIADGGSTDCSLEIINNYCNIDTRFKLVSTQDNGQADAIYKAFQHATGDILCFLNADDTYLCKDALSKVAITFDSYSDVKIISFGGYYIDADGFWLKPVKYRYHPMDGFHLMKYRTAVLQPATFWKKEVYESIEWPKQYHYVFDVVFFYVAYQKFSWLELAKPVAGYRLHGDNKSMTVRHGRIIELAKFEQLKFGQHSKRAYYLKAIAMLIQSLENTGVIGKKLTNIIYLIVNGLAFITCYLLPSI